MNTVSKVYFADLSYLNSWDYARPVPLNVAFVAAYLQKNYPDINIRIFKIVEELQSAIRDAQPDVLALSHYEWNSNLDAAVIRWVKKHSPDTKIILGGPDFHSDEQSWIKRFFELRPEVDAYVTGEGEWSFNSLIKLMNTYGDLKDIPLDEMPSTIFGYDTETSNLVHNAGLPVARLDAATIPSPYLTGILDSFLSDEKLAPIIETNRGCPYSCSFCCWGGATQSKIKQFSEEQILDEIEYICSNAKNKSGILYLADANFGILKRDTVIADKIADCAEKYGFPRRVVMFYAKNTTDKIINIAERLRDISFFSMAQQSTSEDVLEKVGRKNISTDTYEALLEETQSRGIESVCDIILGLPGETYASFIEGIVSLTANGQRINIYPHFLIAGAQSSTLAYREKHGIKSRFRYQPRSVGSFGDEIYASEFEELVVETASMPEDDFYRLRVFNFLIVVLSDKLFLEFNNLIRVFGFNHAEIALELLEFESVTEPVWREFLEKVELASRNEFINETLVKLEFDHDEIESIKNEKPAIFAYYMGYIVIDEDVRTAFKRTMITIIERKLTKLGRQDAFGQILDMFEFSFAKFISFDPFITSKFVPFNYEVLKWLNNGANDELSRYKLPYPVNYEFKVADEINWAYTRAQDAGDELIDVLYYLRVNTLTLNSDYVYSYKIMELDTVDDDKEITSYQLDNASTGVTSSKPI